MNEIAQITLTPFAALAILRFNRLTESDKERVVTLAQKIRASDRELHPLDKYDKTPPHTVSSPSGDKLIVPLHNLWRDGDEMHRILDQKNKS